MTEQPAGNGNRHAGYVSAKLESIHDDLLEIKGTLNAHASWQQAMTLQLGEKESRLSRLEEAIDRLKKTDWIYVLVMVLAGTAMVILNLIEHR